MRKLPILLLSGLFLVAVSCSSTNSSANKTTTTLDASLKDVCAAGTTLAALVKDPGSSPADFKAAAAKIQAGATAISTGAPAEISSQAKATAAAMNQAATTIAAATDASQVTHTLDALVLNTAGDQNLAQYSKWAATHCN